MAHQVPFPFVSDLPPRAQRELERNFLDVQLQFSSGLSIFDAIIDPTLAASTPGTHQYKNLTDLVANESWDTNHVFHVGVKQGNTTRIIEPSTVDITGRGDLILSGLGPVINDDVAGAWQWVKLLASSTQMIFFHRLSIGASTDAAVAGVVSNGIAYFDECYLGQNVSSTGAAIDGTTVICRNCIFAGTQSHSGATQTMKYNNCRFLVGLTLGSSVSIWVIGGEIVGDINVSSTGALRCYADLQGNLTLGGSAECYVDNLGVGGLIVTNSMTAATNVVTGTWTDVTYSGTPTKMRVFRGAGKSLDFTGPGLVEWSCLQSGGGTSATLRGAGVYGRIEKMLGQGVFGVALTNSMLAVSFGVATVFSLDVSSSKNLVLLTGTGIGGWGGTTDSGTGNRIITEASDTYLTTAPAPLGNNMLNGELAAVSTGVKYNGAPAPGGAAGGSLAGTYPNPTFTGRDSSVDKINQDLLPLLLGPQEGVQNFPTQSPPTGAAGGSLTGTYPNPTFAGRDSSVDKLNQDLLPAALLPVADGVQYIPALGAAPSGAAGGSLTGTYPNPTFAGRDSSVDKLNQDMTQTFLGMAD